jgi:hypothetical protein
MGIDALTLAAILVSVIVVAAIVRICTLRGNACNAGNEYLEQQERDSNDDAGAR